MPDRLCGPEVGRRVVLTDAVARIGRGVGCAVPIDDPAISREHAALRIEGDGVSITDRGSVNGTALLAVADARPCEARRAGRNGVRG